MSNVNSLYSNSHFLIYPNPVLNILNIESDASSVGEVYTIYSIRGNEISSGKITSKNMTLNIEHLSNGVYFLKLGKTTKQTFRLIKSSH